MATRTPSIRALLAIASVALAGCASEIAGSGANLDPVDATFLGGVDASSAGAIATLEVANEADVAELLQAGLHPAAAEAIVAFKLGADGEPGTSDDRYFDSLETLDAIEHVGPVAWQRLQEFALSLAPPAPEIASVDSELSSTCWTWSEGELLFMRLINDARERRGIARMRRDPELSRVARRWSGIMAADDELKHNPRVASQVTNWTRLGENVGVISSTGTIEERVRSLHAAFMASTAHRANILNANFRHQGVGIRYGNGKMWATEVFTGGGDPGTTLSMPACN